MTSFSHVKVWGFGFEWRLTHGGPIYIRFAPMDSVQLAAFFGLDILVKKCRLERMVDDVTFPCKSIGIWLRVAFDPWWADLHPVCAKGLSSISGILWTRNLGEKVPTGTQ